MMARIDSQLEKMEAAVDVFEEGLKKLDTTDLEANREKSEAVTEKQDAPKETIRALEDRHADRHLAVGRCRQKRKRAQGDGGSWKKLAAAHWRMTPRAVPAPRKGHGGHRPGKDIVVQETPKGRTFRKRRRAQQKCTNGTRDRGLRGQLRLGSKRALNKTVRQTLGLEVVKRIVGISIGLREVSDWTLWRGRPPPKRRKRLLEA
jgi:hypothetical protein